MVGNATRKRIDRQVYLPFHGDQIRYRIYQEYNYFHIFQITCLFRFFTNGNEFSEVPH